MLGGCVLTCEDGMSDSLGEFFRRFDAALAKWEREQSAPSLVEVVREARHKQPSGYAIVQAAVDWKLAGFDQLPHQRPISEEDVRALFPTYLAELEPIRPATTQEFQQGLGWALTPLGLRGSPVERCADALIDDCHKRGFDGVHVCYWLVEEAERRGRRVPEVAWELFLGRVRPCEAVAVGVAAIRQGNLVAAEGAYRVAMDAEDPQAGPHAACRLGLLRLYQGDAVGAEEAFRFAVASGHTEAAPEAATCLGGCWPGAAIPTRAGRSCGRQLPPGIICMRPRRPWRSGCCWPTRVASRRPWRRWSSKLRPGMRTCRRGRRCCWEGYSAPRVRWLAPGRCLSRRSP